jgi:molybdopterin/thiamine biosynthesis adenylyltransferase
MSERQSRLPNPEFRNWAGKRVRLVQIGVGGIGRPFSKAAVQLGIDRVVAVDPDVVSESDFRAGYAAERVGDPKVLAVGEELTRLNPDIKYTGHPLAASKATRNRLAEIVEGCNIGALIFDDFSNFRSASDLIHSRMPAVAAFMTEEMGEIAWSIPGKTPCLACTLDVARKKQIQGGVSPAYLLEMIALLAVNALEELLYLSYGEGDFQPRLVVSGRNLIYLSWGADGLIEGPSDVVLQARSVGVYGRPHRQNSCRVCRSYLNEKEV